jgi:hypothetical protein
MAWLSNFRVTSLCPEKYSGALLPTQQRRIAADTTSAQSWPTATA